MEILITKIGVEIMKKVIFCEIAWMKYYAGVNDSDKPMNGGKYIDENGEGGEIFNFTPYNHKCYGYVMHQGAELHIERYDKVLRSFDEVKDVTVVWVASDGNSSKIVGWYERATMYRFWQEYYDIAYSGDYHNYYNFVADEKDCYLIDEKKRSFVVPRASIAGKGRGMGQSQVWYADSQYAQNEFIPKVLEYLDSVRDECEPIYWSSEEFEKRAEDKGESPEELIAECKRIYNDENALLIDAMRYINLAINKDDCYKTRFIKAELLETFSWYEEAEEEYKHALYHEENVDGMERLMYVEIMLQHTFLAIELGEKIRKRKDEDEEWYNTANNLVHLYIGEGEIDAAKDLINECKGEADPSIHKWIEGAEERIKEYTKQL